VAFWETLLDATRTALDCTRRVLTHVMARGVERQGGGSFGMRPTAMIRRRVGSARREEGEGSGLAVTHGKEGEGCARGF